MENTKKQFALTLDLESDFSGALQGEYSLLRQPERVESLLRCLQERDVRLSVFVVGELLEKFPQIIHLFEQYAVEFHGHSYSHDPAAPDAEAEIQKCRDIFVRYFGSPPLGYRAPDGRISPQGIKNLEKSGYKFDASIFPSYYPNPFKYLFHKSRVHVYPDSTLIEIPNTPVSPLRIMLSLSYVKLLGPGPFFRLLRWSHLPKTVVFGSHLHDFFVDRSALERMPRFWQWIYGRNQEQGLAYLEKILEFFLQQDYDFLFMSQIYQEFADRINEEKRIKP